MTIQIGHDIINLWAAMKMIIVVVTYILFGKWFWRQVNKRIELSNSINEIGSHLK